MPTPVDVTDAVSTSAFLFVVMPKTGLPHDEFDPVGNDQRLFARGRTFPGPAVARGRSRRNSWVGHALHQ